NLRRTSGGPGARVPGLLRKQHSKKQSVPLSPPQRVNKPREHAHLRVIAAGPGHQRAGGEDAGGRGEAPEVVGIAAARGADTCRKQLRQTERQPAKKQGGDQTLEADQGQEFARQPPGEAGVSDLRALATWTCALRSRGPKQDRLQREFTSACRTSARS